MAGWSIRSAVIAAALASAASAPAMAQQIWAPPPSEDDSWQQSRQDDGSSQDYDGDAPQAGRDESDDRWSSRDDYSPTASQQDYGDDRSDDADDDYRQDSGAQPDDDGDRAQNGGGFASRDAIPPDASPPAPSPSDEANGWGTWRSNPAPAEPNAPPEDHSNAVPQAQRNGWPAPNGPDYSEPETTPGFQASTGIDNRDQAVSSCLAAVRSRVGGGAGAARVDGIKGEWMVSGAVADGRAFYCSIRHGAIDDVEFGS